MEILESWTLVLSLPPGYHEVVAYTDMYPAECTVSFKPKTIGQKTID